MQIMAQCAQRAVWGGVDTHRDQHVAAIVDTLGSTIATRAFAATGQGYCELLVWMLDHGQITAIGIEGTGSYGAGLASYLASCNIVIREIDRPDRKGRRGRGKSDALDAVAAAGATLRGERIVHPKERGGAVESLRNLRIARSSAVSQRANTQRQIKSLIVTAPEVLRAELRSLSVPKLIRRCASLRPNKERITESEHAVKYTLRTLARRHQQLTAEVNELDQLLKQLVCHIKPVLLEQQGIGVEIAGQLLITAGENPERLRNEGAFAMLCGVAPIPASSGRTQRHRLNRGGDRQANRALFTIALVRMGRDPRTQAYVQKRTKEGLSKLEIMRCLKRYIARDIHRILTT